MGFGAAWLKTNSHLGLIVPSAVLALERNMVINPQPPGREADQGVRGVRLYLWPAYVQV